MKRNIKVSLAKTIPSTADDTKSKTPVVGPFAAISAFSTAAQVVSRVPALQKAESQQSCSILEELGFDIPEEQPLNIQSNVIQNEPKRKKDSRRTVLPSKRAI